MRDQLKPMEYTNTHYSITNLNNKILCRDYHQLVVWSEVAITIQQLYSVDIVYNWNLQDSKGK